MTRHQQVGAQEGRFEEVTFRPQAGLRSRGVHYGVRNRAAMSLDRMLMPEKDRLAAQVREHWAEFQVSLSSQKRTYPTRKFEVFWNAAKRYAELTKSDRLIHRAVAEAVNGLVDFLEVGRKRVPADVLLDAQRLECLFFSGYDPNFDGDEPPAFERDFMQRRQDRRPGRNSY
jgi:hypothetical protein